MRPGAVLTVAIAAAITAAVLAHWKREPGLRDPLGGVHYLPVSATVVVRSETTWLGELSIRLLVSGLIIVVFARAALLIAKHWPDGLPERQLIRPRQWWEAA